jgi:hypothetical protein
VPERASGAVRQPSLDRQESGRYQPGTGRLPRPRPRLHAHRAGSRGGTLARRTACPGSGRPVQFRCAPPRRRSAWLSVASRTAANLRSVWGDSATDVWVVRNDTIKTWRTSCAPLGVSPQTRQRAARRPFLGRAARPSDARTSASGTVPWRCRLDSGRRPRGVCFINSLSVRVVATHRCGGDAAAGGTGWPRGLGTDRRAGLRAMTLAPDRPWRSAERGCRAGARLRRPAPA